MDDGFAERVEHIQINLETRRCDVKTVWLIWAAESPILDLETTGQALGQVVDVIMKVLEKSGLLPVKP